MLTRHATCKAVLRDSALFSSRNTMLPQLRRYVGEDAMSTRDGAAHAEIRRRYATAFTTSKVAEYFDIILESTRQMWGDVEKRVSNGGTLEISDDISVHFLRVVVAFSTSMPLSDNDATGSMLTNITSLLGDVIDSLYQPDIWPFSSQSQARYDALQEILLSVLQSHLKQKRAAIEVLSKCDAAEVAEELASSESDIDVAAVTIAQSLNENDDESLALQRAGQDLLGVWLAGFITSAPSTLSALYKLAHDEGGDSDLWDDLRREQAGILELTSETTTNDMPLLESFLMEVLRLHGPTFVLFRQASAHTTLENVHIPGNSMLGIDVMSAHHDKIVFENPEHFDPRRFLNKDGRLDKKKAAEVLSFSAAGSPHFCLGAMLAKTEIKTVIAVLIREFEDVSFASDDRSDPLWGKRFDDLPLVAPTDGVRITSLVSKRNGKDGRCG